MRTWFVRVVRKLRPFDVVLGTSAKLTADAARKKAVAAIEAAQAEREPGPVSASGSETPFRHRSDADRTGNARVSGLKVLRLDTPCS